MDWNEVARGTLAMIEGWRRFQVQLAEALTPHAETIRAVAQVVRPMVETVNAYVEAARAYREEFRRLVMWYGERLGNIDRRSIIAAYRRWLGDVVLMAEQGIERGARKWLARRGSLDLLDDAVGEGRLLFLTGLIRGPWIEPHLAGSKAADVVYSQYGRGRQKDYKPAVNVGANYLPFLMDTGTHPLP